MKIINPAIHTHTTEETAVRYDFLKGGKYFVTPKIISHEGCCYFILLFDFYLLPFLILIFDLTKLDNDNDHRVTPRTMVYRDRSKRSIGSKVIIKNSQTVSGIIKDWSLSFPLYSFSKQYLFT